MAAERYGVGLPSVGRRSLTEHERRRLRGRVRVTLVQCVALVVAVVCSMAFGVRVAPVLDPGTVETVGGPFGIGVCVSGLVGGAGCLAFARGSWRIVAAAAAMYLLGVASLLSLAPDLRTPHPAATWIVVAALVLVGNGFIALRISARARIVGRWRRIQADLGRGEVEQFEGRLPSTLDPALRALNRDGQFEPTMGQHRVEALPTSGLIVRVDGRLPGVMQVAYMAEVAPTQPHAFRASLPDGIAPTGTGTLQRRSLTPAERKELDAHIQRLRRRYWPAILVSISLVLVTSWEVHTAGSWRGLLGGTCIAWYVLAAFTYAAYVRRIRAASKLALDRDLRWVVTVDAETQGREPLPPRLEVLPISQLAWTENATPAPWRVARF
jgi:hypothetical protein